MAASTAKLTATRRPVKKNGSAVGTLSFQNSASRPPPIERIRRDASSSVALNPSSRDTVVGKKVTSTITRTLGRRPNPNQITKSGAITMVGIDCEATSSGYTTRLAIADRSIAVARMADTARAHAMPTTVSSIVGTALDQSWPRLVHPWAATRAGVGRTVGLG